MKLSEFTVSFLRHRRSAAPPLHTSDVSCTHEAQDRTAGSAPAFCERDGIWLNRYRAFLCERDLFEKPQQVAGKTGGLKRPSLVTNSIVKQPGFARAGYAGHGPRVSSADVRHRPVFGPAPGLAGLPVPCFPVGACGTTGRFTAPAAPACLDTGSPHAAFAAHGQWPSPTPKIVELNRAVEADLRLRSARGWILRLAACPRGCHWRRRPPVRASCRPDMHLDRPPVLPASIPVRLLIPAIDRNPQHPGPAS